MSAVLCYMVCTVYNCWLSGSDLISGKIYLSQSFWQKIPQSISVKMFLVFKVTHSEAVNSIRACQFGMNSELFPLDEEHERIQLNASLVLCLKKYIPNHALASFGFFVS